MTDAQIMAECAALDAAYAAADDEAARNAHPSVSVDLKWSLWSCDASIWEAHAPDAWRQVRAALTEMPEGCSLTISTAPRKEIRFGTITIRWHKGDLVADVSLRAEWDEPRALAETLLSTRLRYLADRSPPSPPHEALRRLGVTGRTEPTDDEIERMCAALGDRFSGTQVSKTVDLPDTVDDALVAIDAVEDLLIQADEAAWNDLSAAVEDGYYDHVLDADALTPV